MRTSNSLCPVQGSEKGDPAAATRGAGSEEGHTLELVAKLCAELDSEEISYCHWKSNQALDRSASGDNDLDLLVGAADSGRLAAILGRLSFKQTVCDPVHEAPGVLDFYGMDDKSGRLVHAHVHYRMIIGHDKTKNYRLPVEEAYLASAVQGPLFSVPSPEHELIVFTVRMLLKHATWDALLTLEGPLSGSEELELKYLTGMADTDRLAAILRRDFTLLDATLFEECTKAVQPGSSVGLRVKTARRLEARLAGDARRPPAVDTALKLWRRFYWRSRRFLIRRPVRNLQRPENGGVVIAVVGGDGSGKSSAVAGLRRWLSSHFVTRRIHLGKPRPSAASIAVKAVLRTGRTLGLFKATPNTSPEIDVDAQGRAWMLWQVMIARDRHRAYVRTRRLALNGAIVICDRYPLPELRLMDRPRLDFPVGGSRIRSFLARLEKSYYARILPPEVLIVLRVDPEEAVRRRIDESPAVVRMRCREVWEMDWRRTPASVVDANRSPEDVLSEIKSLVWPKL